MGVVIAVCESTIGGRWKRSNDSLLNRSAINALLTKARKLLCDRVWIHAG